MLKQLFRVLLQTSTRKFRILTLNTQYISSPKITQLKVHGREL